jgi:polysaccharide pyruvyl transferase WcaK-like protein
MRTKVAVTGYYGSGNLGDVLLLGSVVRVLRTLFSPGDIALHCRDQPYLRVLFPGVRVVEPGSESGERGSLLVYGGGTQFFSFPLSRSTLLTRVMRALMSPGNACRGVARKVMSRTREFDATACLGIGIGPFVPGSQEERRTRQLLQACEFVAVRDAQSAAYCERWGIGHAVVGADLCFADTALADLLPSSRERGTPRSIAAIVRDWPHSREGAAYLEPLMQCTDRLRANGYAVTFYSFCGEDDDRLIRCLSERGHAVAVWRPERDAIDGFLREIAAHEIMVTARYHGAVLASLMRMPFICVEVEPKLRLAAETLGMAQYLWRQSFSPDALSALVERLSADYGNASACATEAAERQRVLAQRMLTEFTSFVRRVAL